MLYKKSFSNRTVRFCLLLLVISWLILFCNTNYSLVRATENPPSPSGDWIISNGEDWTHENKAFILNGSLVVENGGILNLRNVTLRMNNTNSEFNITIRSGGKLILENCTVTVLNINDFLKWFLKAESGSDVRLLNSTFNYAGRIEGTHGDHSGLWINTNDAIVLNCSINNNYFGLYAYQAKNGTFANNTITNSIKNGIILLSSSNNTISGNMVTNISTSSSSGICLGSSNNTIVSGNTVTNSSARGIYLQSSGNCTVSGNTVTNTTIYGIDLDSVENCTVSGNTVTNNSAGIRIAYSCNNTVSGNTITNSSSSGIRMYSSNNSCLVSNNISNITDQGGFGIYINSAVSNNVSYNTLTDSWYGIYLDNSGGYCQIWGNTMGANFLGQTSWTAYDRNGTNQWDNGTHGNWYSDYDGYDLNQDGIGDTPYTIPGDTGVQDNYPLVIPEEANAPTIDSPSDITYEEGTIGHSITWSPSDVNPAWYNITKDGAKVSDGIWDGSPITVDIDGLSPGTYTYIINAYDRFGNLVSDSVSVTVTEKELMSESTHTSEIPGFGVLSVIFAIALGFLTTRCRKSKKLV
ncbi:MAG: nitrous oxide reductase family maturation protein NosD [Candidatus Thorarchaeota archaeon]